MKRRNQCAEREAPMKKNQIFKSRVQKNILCSFTILLLLLGLVADKQMIVPDDKNTAISTLNSKKPNPLEDLIDRD